MEPVGQFLAAHRDGCRECTHTGARKALACPDEITAFLGSGYAWALRQTKATHEALTSAADDEEEGAGEPLFREASARLLRLGSTGQVGEMHTRAREAPASVLQDVLNDAGTAYTLEKGAMWTSSPEETPPPWVTVLGQALEYLDTSTGAEEAGDEEGAAPAHQEPETATAPVSGGSPARPRRGEATPQPAPAAERKGGPPLILGDRTTKRFMAAGDAVPLRRRVWRRVLKTLEKRAAPRAFAPPPGCGPGEGPGTPWPSPTTTADPPAPPAQEKPATPAPPAGPPRTTSAPVAPAPEDEAEADDIPTGIVHTDPGVTLDELRQQVGDPTPEQAETTKARIRALLWAHAGDTAAVRRWWVHTHGRPPGGLYKYARQWAQDLVNALAAGHEAADIPATLDTLGVHRTPSMDTAVQEWITAHTADTGGTVTPLRRTG